MEIKEIKKEAAPKPLKLTPDQMKYRKAMLESYKIQEKEIDIQIKGLAEAIDLGLPEKKAKVQLMGLKSQRDELIRNANATERRIKEN